MFQFKAKFSAVMLDGCYPQLVVDLVVVTRPHSQSLSILGSPFPLILLPSDLSLHPTHYIEPQQLTQDFM